MPGTFTPMFAHYVWSTWERQPLIDPLWEGQLHACISAKCKSLGSLWVMVNGMPDHVHVLLRLPPMHGYAVVAKHMKGASSHLVNHVLAPGIGFRWQGSYYSRTVNPDDLDPVRAYVRSQKLHHAHSTTIAAWEQLAEDER